MVIDLDWTCPVCGGKMFSEVHHSDVRLPGVKKTNRDVLMLMSNAELAEWLCRIQYREGDICAPVHNVQNCRFAEGCKDCWLDWLNKEVDNDGD